MREKWLAWAGKGNTQRRCLLIQMYAAEKFPDRWLSFEHSLDKMLFAYATPEDSVETLNKLCAVAKSFDWSISKIRAHYK